MPIKTRAEIYGVEATTLLQEISMYPGLTEAQLGQMLTVANTAASIVTTRRGALRVMPTVDEINAAL